MTEKPETLRNQSEEEEVKFGLLTVWSVYSTSQSDYSIIWLTCRDDAEGQVIDG